MMISPNRITGLATGMDTDNMVKQMMKPYLMRMDKLKQDRQIVQWRQDLLREMIGNVGGLKRNYFDVLKSDKYMLSGNAVSTFSVDGLTDNSLKVKAGAGAKVGSYEVTVDKLAQTAKLEGTSTINTVVVGKPNFGIKIDNTNNSFIIGDSTTLSLKLDSVKGYNKYSSLSELASAMNNATGVDGVESLKLSDKNIKAVVKNDSIQFMELIEIKEDKADPTKSNNKISFTYDGNSYEVTLAAGKYTADELVSAINSKASGLKSTTDSSIIFPSKEAIVAETTKDGTTFKTVTKDENGNIVDTNNSVNIDIIKTLTTKSIGVAKTAATGTDADVVDNKLTYKNEVIKDFNDTLNIRVGSETKVLKLDPGEISNTAQLVDLINTSKVYTYKADGTTVDKVEDATDIFTMKTSGENNEKIKFESKTDKQLSIYGNASSVFGAYDNFEINMTGSTKVSDLEQFKNKAVDFIINDKQFTYDFAGADANKTIEQIINDINSKAGVKMTYSSASKKFTIESNSTGSNSSLTFKNGTSGTADFLSTIFGVNSASKLGEDAKVTITGPNGPSTYLKPQNSFEVDGVTYNLNSMPTGTVKFSLTQNTDEAFNKIKAFIDDYNKLIGDINSKTSEKKQYKYVPLTDDQKKDMKDTDIKIWEDKAKEGLVRNDSDLSNMLGSLRRAFYDSVKDVGLSLRDIGLDTSSDYSENGKIVIDETKLREAIKNNGDKVTELLTKKSSSFSRYDPNMSSSARDTRYKEEGIFQRISDILEDYTRTTSGKGILLNKAGIKGDFTDTNNTISEDLKNRDKKIKEMEEKLFDRENKYYLQFARLEKVMQQMNAQSNWLAQQLGGGSK